MDLTTDAYKVLHLDPTADEVVIAAAYRALAKRFHPDGNTPNPERMAQVNAAYAILRDPDRRRGYDIRRSMHASHVAGRDPGEQRRVDASIRPASRTESAHVLDFGRYAGWSIAQLARHDPDYLRWLCRHSSGLRFREAIVRMIGREPDMERRANSVA